MIGLKRGFTLSPSSGSERTKVSFGRAEPEVTVADLARLTQLQGESVKLALLVDHFSPAK